MILAPERRSVEFMIYLLYKFTWTEELVLDTCNDTLVSAKMLLLLTELCRFVNFEEDISCVQD